ncbi:hypothetical protein WJX72_000811 [[Myrmecia] bisecta]|uniref:RING-type domain-containing protein n=1 Tax=[Myrmecia] bisecta TaxID=41462 RepID=A0AAW1PNT1_9CHLO
MRLDGVLSFSGANVVEGVIKAIALSEDPYAPAKCSTQLSAGSRGYKVAVAVMQQMQLQDGLDAAQQAEVFAKALHDAWGVGDASCNNGVLLLLSKGDRQVYMSVGSGATALLTPDRIAGIIEAIKPDLRAGKFDQGIQRAVVETGLVLAGQEGEPESGGSNWWELSFVGMFFAAFGYLWYRASSQSRRRRGDFRRCQDLLARLKREQAEAIKTQRYPSASCPVCFADFDTPAEDGSPVEPSAPPLPAEDQASGSGNSAEQEEGIKGNHKHLHKAGSQKEPLLSKGDADSDAQQAQRAVTPLTLPCHHVICETCLTRWLEESDNCPICRASMGTSDPRPNTRRFSAPHQQRDVYIARDNRRPPAYDPCFYQSELQYRLHNLHMQYPDFVTPHIINIWTNQVVHGGGVITPETTVEFQMNDPTTQQHYASSGASGSAGFGGGSSFGGGGGGGSW